MTAPQTDLEKVMLEFYEYMSLSLDNCCKKLQNLQCGGPKARSDISIAISGLWAVWLEQCPAKERADYFSFGLKAISDDLMELRMREVNNGKKI